jgi:hypothetical protein
MDTDTLKLAMPFLGGAMGLAGGVLAFINGRLNEAKTQADRARVYYRTRQSVSYVSCIIGCVFFIVFHSYLALIGLLFYILIYIICVYDFLQNRSPITRVSIVIFTTYTGFYAGLLALLLSFGLITPLIQQEQTATNQVLNVIEREHGFRVESENKILTLIERLIASEQAGHSALPIQPQSKKPQP